jgi:hypothetical protein
VAGAGAGAGSGSEAGSGAGLLADEECISNKGKHVVYNQNSGCYKDLTTGKVITFAYPFSFQKFYYDKF